MHSCRLFRVMLNAENWQFPAAHTFNRLVVQVDLGINPPRATPRFAVSIVSLALRPGSPQCAHVGQSRRDDVSRRVDHLGAHDTKKPSASTRQTASSWLASQCQLKDASNVSTRLRTRFLAGLPPVRPVFHDPVQQRSLKPDVVPRLLALQPLVTQNFFALSQKLTVQRRVHHDLSRVAAYIVYITHGQTLLPHSHTEA